MKKIITFLLLLSSITAFSKSPTDSIRLALSQARTMANAKSPKYNPQKAFDTYNRLATQGNAEAMNGLGMLYSQGIGVAVDDSQALKWYANSAQNGYNRAFYNLALLYKTGVGTNIDLVKAYQLYKQGADLNDAMCTYGQGYMLYKGYGCTQNYPQAAISFKKGASLRDEGSFYMLGLCYRNGYGLAINLDSAKYWLGKAAARGDHRAIEELASPDPENADIKDVPNIQPSASATVQPVNLKTGFKQIKNHIITDDIAGEYTGYAIKFDWSGKHIIGQAALKLKLQRNNKELNGEWQEEGQQPVALAATLTDTAVVFNNTAWGLVDHYHKAAAPLATEFKDSHFNLVKSKDTVFLSGTISMYSTKFKESEKPEFMMLIRTGNANHDISDTSFHLAFDKADSLHFIAYPNPFVNSLQLRYTLKKEARVSILVSNLLNGSIVYRGVPDAMLAGDHTTPVIFNGPPGNYVITLCYGNKIKSAIVFKQ